MARPLKQQVIVITGASTGIGRETALAAAGRGASVVLAARGETGLNAVAERIRAGGSGAAHVVVTDVTDPAQVERLAGEAVARFGRIDTWVNNAGVSEYATVEQMTPAEIEQIVRVDLLGTIYGCKAAIPHMKGSGGTIVNVGSGFSERAVPLQSVYCAAKHGVKGFTEALRLELAREQSGIQVTLILPSSVNTPLFEHARSKTGHKPKPLGRVYEPEVVADAILYAAEHARRDVYVGGTAKLLSLMETVSPGLLDWLMLQRDWAASGQLSDEPDDGRDNLFGPMANGRIAAKRTRRARSRSVYTDVVERHPVVSRLLLGAMAVGVAVGLVRSVTGLGERRAIAVR